MSFWRFVELKNTCSETLEFHSVHRISPPQYHSDPILVCCCVMRFWVVGITPYLHCLAGGAPEVPVGGFSLHLWALDPYGFLAGNEFPVIHDADELFVLRLVREKKIPESHVRIAKEMAQVPPEPVPEPAIIPDHPNTPRLVPVLDIRRFVIDSMRGHRLAGYASIIMDYLVDTMRKSGGDVRKLVELISEFTCAGMLLEAGATIQSSIRVCTSGDTELWKSMDDILNGKRMNIAEIQNHFYRLSSRAEGIDIREFPAVEELKIIWRRFLKRVALRAVNGSIISAKFVTTIGDAELIHNWCYQYGDGTKSMVDILKSGASEICTSMLFAHGVVQAESTCDHLGSTSKVRDLAYAIINGQKSYDPDQMKKLILKEKLVRMAGEVEPGSLLWYRFATLAGIRIHVDNEILRKVISTIDTWAFGQIDPNFIDNQMELDLALLPTKSEMITEIKKRFLTKCRALFIVEAEGKKYCQLVRDNFEGIRRDAFDVLNGNRSAFPVKRIPGQPGPGKDRTETAPKPPRKQRTRNGSHSNRRIRNT
jgi:hypothetical protein